MSAIKQAYESMLPKPWPFPMGNFWTNPVFGSYTQKTVFPDF